MADKRWAVHAGERVVKLDDLPLDLFMPVARRHDLSWYELLNYPARNLEGLFELICIVCEQVEFEPPAKPDTIGGYARLTDWLEQVDDDVPSMWEAPEGAQFAVPPQAAETATT